jgi:cytochrome c oxidase subunit IV
MAHGASGTLHGAVEHHDEHAHPGERTYIKVAVVLAIITIVEVAIWYLDLPHWFLVTALLVLSAVKFCIVVGYFMHLKFDDKRLLAIFAGGLFLGGAILLALDVLTNVDSLDYANDMIGESAAPAEEH